MSSWDLWETVENSRCGCLMIDVDVLCVGIACYDLTFAIPAHPEPDSKNYATSLISCGGGLAANAAVAVARLGYRTAFLTQLGQDIFGNRHVQELEEEGVLTDLVTRTAAPTPLSSILAKPDGTRALTHYREQRPSLSPDLFDFSQLKPTVILFDGHEQLVARPLATWAREQNIPTVLDADSRNAGTDLLVDQVDFLVCSRRFAQDFTGEETAIAALDNLVNYAPYVVITLGAQGLVWGHGSKRGVMPAFPIEAVDSTGAGDAFHGAFAAAIATGMGWLETLRYASAVGALTCTKMGARLGIPTGEDVAKFLEAEIGD